MLAFTADRIYARRSIHLALVDIAENQLEEAVRQICYATDEYLSSEGHDGWTCEVTISGDIDVPSFVIFTYWRVSVLKRILSERSGIAFNHLCIMHAGMELLDERFLFHYELFDVAHDGRMPVFFVSRREL